jgi:hypothetical protein
MSSMTTGDTPVSDAIVSELRRARDRFAGFGGAKGAFVVDKDLSLLGALYDFDLNGGVSIGGKEFLYRQRAAIYLASLLDQREPSLFDAEDSLNGFNDDPYTKRSHIIDILNYALYTLTGEMRIKPKRTGKRG